MNNLNLINIEFFLFFQSQISNKIAPILIAGKCLPVS